MILMPLRDPRRQKQLQKLIEKLGLLDNGPIQWSLLDRALTHPTFSPDNYEQLEFVGDAVIRVATAQLLFKTYPESSVGELSAIRSVLVSDRALARIADSYGLERYLLVAPSAAKDSTGQQSRLAESLEAVVGALYLSCHDLTLVNPWLVPQLLDLAQEVCRDPAHQNYKAALQAWTQAQYKTLPEYRIEDTQPHPQHPSWQDTPQSQQLNERRYQAEVWVQGQILGQGRGRSIKAAEKAAAEAAFLKLQAATSVESQVAPTIAQDL